MRKLTLVICCLLLLCGCHKQVSATQVVATTLPAYEFTKHLCSGTGIQVTQLITENVSCLHDYTLKTSQMQAVESAQAVVISGAGLEDFLEDILIQDKEIDASLGVDLLHEVCEHDHDHTHSHENDPHIWLSPVNAKIMASNICNGLSQVFPQHKEAFTANLMTLHADLDRLQAYGEECLKSLSCRKLVTFHDGFAYFAQAFDLEVLKAVEEEAGSETTASELIEIIGLIRQQQLPAIFTESNGSTAAATIIARETGVKTYTLDMGMAGESYFDAMYRNIDVMKEALG